MDKSVQEATPDPSSPPESSAAEGSARLFSLNHITFPSLMNNWVAHDGGTEARFLRNTGLEKILKPGDVEAMVAGKTAPNESLARVMAMHLPGDLLRPGEPSAPSLRGFHGFLFEAKAWHNNHSGNRDVGTLDIAEHDLDRFCANTLDRIKALSPARTRTERTVPVSVSPYAKLQEDIVSSVQRIEGSRSSIEQIEGGLAEEYRTSPEETLSALSNLLSRSRRAFDKAQLREWLEVIAFPEKQPPAVQQLPFEAQALRFMRRCSGLSQEALAEQIKADRPEVPLSGQAVVSSWENGIKGINPNLLGTITRHLSLPAGASAHFIRLMRPDIDKGMPEDWLEKKMAIGRWDSINFPALDESWLAAQPLGNREKAGLLLAGFRERRGFSQEKLAEYMKAERPGVQVSGPAVHYWEDGKNPIEPSTFSLLSKCLSLAEEESERLITLARPGIDKDMPEGWLRRKIAAGNWESIDYPALDADWLSKQRPEKQAGMLLAGFRERKGLMQKEVAARIGVSDSTARTMESGGMNIPKARLDALSAALELGPEERRHLEDVNERSRQARNMRKSSTQVGAALPASEAHDLLLPSQTARRR